MINDFPSIRGKSNVTARHLGRSKNCCSILWYMHVSIASWLADRRTSLNQNQSTGPSKASGSIRLSSPTRPYLSRNGPPCATVRVVAKPDFPCAAGGSNDRSFLRQRYGSCHLSCPLPQPGLPGSERQGDPHPCRTPNGRLPAGGTGFSNGVQSSGRSLNSAERIGTKVQFGSVAAGVASVRSSSSPQAALI